MTVWNSKNGPIAVDDMTEDHAKNVLKMLIRNNMIKRPERIRPYIHPIAQSGMLDEYIEKFESELGS